MTGLVLSSLVTWLPLSILYELLCILIYTHGYDISGNEDGYIISIESFDASKVEWDSWSYWFNQWLKISTYAEGEHSADKMQAAFCTFIGSDTTTLLCSLCALKKQECRYDALK